MHELRGDQSLKIIQGPEILEAHEPDAIVSLQSSARFLAKDPRESTPRYPSPGIGHLPHMLDAFSILLSLNTKSADYTLSAIFL